MRSVALIAFVAVLSPTLSACTPVPAWDRSRLAHPTMQPGSSAGLAESHLHDVQEGAIGGGATEGGGCGCN